MNPSNIKKRSEPQWETTMEDRFLILARISKVEILAIC